MAFRLFCSTTTNNCNTRMAKSSRQKRNPTTAFELCVSVVLGVVYGAVISVITAARMASLTLLYTATAVSRGGRCLRSL